MGKGHASKETFKVNHTLISNLCTDFMFFTEFAKFTFRGINPILKGIFSYISSNIIRTNSPETLAKNICNNYMCIFLRDTSRF